MAKMENQISPSLDEELPEEVHSGLQGLMPPGTRLQLSVSSDIKLDGEYGPAWLVATEERLVAFSPNGGGAPDIIDFPLAEIDQLEIREHFGSGMLKVRSAEKGTTVALFSKSLIPKFAELPERIEALVRQARPAGDEKKLVEGRVGEGRGKGKRCERCDRVISHWHGVCPACLEKGKLLFRRIFTNL